MHTPHHATNSILAAQAHGCVHPQTDRQSLNGSHTRIEVTRDLEMVDPDPPRLKCLE